MPTNLIPVAGPSGAGKDTVISEIDKKFGSKIRRIVPCTTRIVRTGEIEGVHQYFLSIEEFEEKERNNQFVFTNPPNPKGYRSGTLKTELIDGTTSIIDITARGAGILRDYVIKSGGSVLPFFIYANYITRYNRIQKRQEDLSAFEIKKMLEYDLTDPDPENHPDWFIKIENPDGKFKETFKKISIKVSEFIELVCS